MPVPSKQRVHITLHGPERERLEAAASEAGVPTSTLIRRIVETVARHAGDHIDAWERVIDSALGLAEPQETLPLTRRAETTRKRPSGPENANTEVLVRQPLRPNTKSSGKSAPAKTDGK